MFAACASTARKDKNATAPTTKSATATANALHNHPLAHTPTRIRVWRKRGQTALRTAKDAMSKEQAASAATGGETPALPAWMRATSVPQTAFPAVVTKTRSNAATVMC